MAEWHTTVSARDEWPDAPVDEDEGDDQLSNILEAAKTSVIAYAPVVETPLVDIPSGYRQAQLMEAQNIWNAGKLNPSQFFDGEGQTTAPFQQWHSLVRPKRGRPVLA